MTDWLLNLWDRYQHEGFRRGCRWLADRFDIDLDDCDDEERPH